MALEEETPLITLERREWEAKAFSSVFSLKTTIKKRGKDLGYNRFHLRSVEEFNLALEPE